MDIMDSLAIGGTIGVVVAIAAFLFWLASIVAFFSMAINLGRIRKDVRVLQRIVVAQSQQHHQQPPPQQHHQQPHHQPAPPPQQHQQAPPPYQPPAHAQSSVESTQPLPVQPQSGQHQQQPPPPPPTQ